MIDTPAGSLLPFTTLRVGSQSIIESVESLCDRQDHGHSPRRDTDIVRERGDVVLYFHDTPIVRFKRDRIVLARGSWLGEGWLRRVNNAVGWLSICVYTATDGVTYVRAGGQIRPMRDGLEVYYATALGTAQGVTDNTR